MRRSSRATPHTGGPAGREACTIIRRLWAEDEPFDFDGAYHQLTGAWCNPKPLQRPHPPILIGGRSLETLRVVAQHADVWNMPGGDLDDAVRRSALLDRLCAESGREPASITRSIILPVSYDRPAATRDAIRGAIGAGFAHVVLSLSPPVPGRRGTVGRPGTHRPGHLAQGRAMASPSHTPQEPSDAGPARPRPADQTVNRTARARQTRSRPSQRSERHHTTHPARPIQGTPITRG